MRSIPKASACRACTWVGSHPEVRAGQNSLQSLGLTKEPLQIYRTGTDTNPFPLKHHFSLHWVSCQVFSFDLQVFKFNLVPAHLCIWDRNVCTRHLISQRYSSEGQGHYKRPFPPSLWRCFPWLSPSGSSQAQGIVLLTKSRQIQHGSSARSKLSITLILSMIGL